MDTDREQLLARMKEAGGGSVALEMEIYDLLAAMLVCLERIARALETGGSRGSLE
jgi:hypothetical protein